MELFDELNKRRKKCVPFVIIGYILAGLGFFGFILMFFLEFYLRIIILSLFLVGIILVVIGYTKYNKLRKDFKDVYVKKLIEEQLPNCTYRPNMGIPIATIYQSNLVKKAARSKVEDLIVGSYEGVNYSTCDVKLEERHVHHTGSGTSTTYITYFQGKFFEFDFNKSINGQIVVTEGSLPNWNTAFEKIELENINFNEKFKTYTTDEHSAFYVLTSHFADSLLELEQKYRGVLALSFSGSKLYIALDNRRDSFEIKLMKNIDENSVLAFQNDLQIIPNMIKILKLDNKLYKEEE